MLRCKWKKHEPEGDNALDGIKLMVNIGAVYIQHLMDIQVYYDWYEPHHLFRCLTAIYIHKKEGGGLWK